MPVLRRPRSKPATRRPAEYTPSLTRTGPVVPVIRKVIGRPLPSSVKRLAPSENEASVGIWARFLTAGAFIGATWAPAGTPPLWPSGAVGTAGWAPAVAPPFRASGAVGVPAGEPVPPVAACAGEAAKRSGQAAATA